jgi:outer membrane receptor for ferrienterochelin and colicins
MSRRARRPCRDGLRTALLLVVALLALHVPRAQAQALVRGLVVDSATGEAVSGVRVAVIPDSGRAPPSPVFTAEDGRFALSAPAGPYALVFSRIGYARRAIHLEGPQSALRVALVLLSIPLDEVVVTASRTPQTALEAPTALSVLDRRDVETAVGLTPVDQVSRVPGVDYARKGLMQSEFTVRGASGVNAAGLLMLVDYRYAQLPSIGFNIPYLLPSTREDVERIEVVRGPGAALYGPGAARGLLHVITRSPFESRGLVVSATGGGRDVQEATLRYAAALGSRLAFAVSGDMSRGTDWQTTDSVEERNRADALAGGAAADTLRIGSRDATASRAGGEVRLDWRPAASTSVVASAGVAEAVRAIDLTSEVGAVQARDWRYTFAQATLRHARLFVNAQYDLGDAGSTYVLRTGEPLVDHSRMAAVQVQHGATLGPVDWLYGADLRWTDPRTRGTIDGANEAHDALMETGAYVHGTTRLSPRLDLVTAVRVDRHDRLNDLVVSPRAAIVFKPGPTHAFRLSYNRAFSSPDPSDLFADIVEGVFPGGLPFAVRAGSVPQHGFSFRRDCGGPCMRSPFDPAGPDSFVPADATLEWPAVMAILQQQGVDLSGIPQPTAAQVATVLAALDPHTGGFDPVAPGDVRDIPALRRTITTSVELGYRGVTSGGLAISVDLYRTHVRDPLGDRYVATPNVFLDGATLQQYLSAFMPAAQAAQVAAEAAGIPVGTVSPQQAPHPVDVLLLRSQGGAYSVVGADVSLSASLSAGWSAEVTGSWISSDSIPCPGGAYVLNVPRTKGTAAVEYRRGRWTAALRGRAVSGYPVASGVYAGRVDGYITTDALVAYRLSAAPEATLTVNAWNLLDHRHREMVGAPTLGRLVTARLRLAI